MEEGSLQPELSPPSLPVCMACVYSTHTHIRVTVSLVTACQVVTVSGEVVPWGEQRGCGVQRRSLPGASWRTYW